MNEPMPKSMDLIDDLRSTASPKEVTSIQNLIEIEARHVQEQNVAPAFIAATQAEINQQRIVEQIKEHNQQGPEAIGGSLTPPDEERGNIWLLVSALISLFVVIVAEYEVTLETIPYALNLRKSDGGAILLCLSIVLAVTTTLKIAFGKLFWEPYQKLRDNTSVTKAKRVALKLTMTAYLILMGGVGIFTVAKISTARSEAIKLKESIRTEKPITVDPKPIDDAIWFLALSLVLSGGLFFLVADEEWKKIRTHRKAEKFRAEQERLAQELDDAQVQLADKQRALKEAEVKAKLAADHYRERHLLALAQALKRLPQPRPYVDRTEEILANCN